MKRNRTIRRFAGVLGIAILTGLVSTARAQFTADYQTNTISGVTSNWNNNYYVGNNFAFDGLEVVNSGRLLLNNSHTIYMGYTANASNNSILVSGSGSTLSNFFNLYLGYAGGGNQMAITAGGTVVNDNDVNHGVGFVGYLSGSNSVLVSGNGSSWRTAGLVVGTDYGGSGNSLVISNGGAVFGGGGTLTGSNNTALVTGIGSVWSNSGVLFGGRNNDVKITDGGVLYSGFGYIGSNSPPSGKGASVLVSDAGSIWNNPGELYLGLWGGAGSSLTISNGGMVNSGTAYVGWDAISHTSSNENVMVTGNGSVWNNQGTIYVGFSGNVGNSVSINNGGKVVTSNMIVSAKNLLSLNAGTLVAPGGLTISSNATLKGTGTIIGPTTIAGGGLLSPGFSPGILTFSNALTLAANANLLIELAGYGPGEFDQLIANGATIDGSILQLQLLGGFVPTNGAQFAILDNFSGGSIDGTFAGLAEGSTNDFGSGIEFSISYAGNGPSGGANDILLTVVPEPSTWVLLMLGCGCLRIMRRRWRSGG